MSVSFLYGFSFATDITDHVKLKVAYGESNLLINNNNNFVINIR